MSKEEDKIKHGTRLHQVWRAIKKQLGIIRAHKNFGTVSKSIDEAQPHRLAKHHAMDCGNAHCTLCGNPRHNRARKDKLTIQEKRNNQKAQDE
jgi:NADH:ubiquinone oxidoreductase subunit E